MGIIRRGILGGFSGKVANVVGSSWKGISVMKSLPLSVANPRTAGQVAQRTKFGNVVAFATLILSGFIKPLWDRFAQRESGYNAFISANIDLFENEVPDPLADLVLSDGKMSETNPTDVSLVNATTASIDWVNDSGEGLKLSTDESYAIIYNETRDSWALAGTPVPLDNRSAGTKNVGGDLSDWVVGDTVHAYLAFRRQDGTVVSKTGYYTGTLSTP